MGGGPGWKSLRKTKGHAHTHAIRRPCVNSLQKRLKVPFRDGSSKDEALSSTFPHNAGKGNSIVWEISVNTFRS